MKERKIHHFHPKGVIRNFGQGKESELVLRFIALNPLVQQYVLAADGMHHIISVSRMNEERRYLLNLLDMMIRSPNHEELIVQLGDFLSFRNQERGGYTRNFPPKSIRK